MAQHLTLVLCPHLGFVLLRGPILAQSPGASGRAKGCGLLPSDIGEVRVALGLTT